LYLYFFKYIVLYCLDISIQAFCICIILEVKINCIFSLRSSGYACVSSRRSSPAAPSTGLVSDHVTLELVAVTFLKEMSDLETSGAGLMKNELVPSRRRIKTGLDKLLLTEKEVTKLHADLEIMQPLLAEAVEETMATMETIAVDSPVAAETRIVVQRDEEEAVNKAKGAEAIADDAQREMDEALPALEAALASLKSLNKNVVTEVKSMKYPPEDRDGDLIKASDLLNSLLL